jgi:2-amino-4-hydroxy-6-hydroxymethyldihydropteridine diphosphokinase
VGERPQFLKEAIEKIAESDKISIRRVSSVYESQPVGYENQGWFLNLVVEVQTSFEPVPLLEHLLSVEEQMGRKRGKKWGPRNIDLDMLFYENHIIDSDRLTVPHPRMHQRRFVLEPLAQIAPEFLHPLLGKSVRELLESCEDESVVRLYSEKV